MDATQAFRRVLRSTRRLSELGHSDNFSALEELKSLRAENQKLKALMRRALPTIDSRITDYADDYRAACVANNLDQTRGGQRPA